MQKVIPNKHGIASALISGVLIMSFFMPLIDFLFINVSTFKLFSELAKSNLKEQWLGVVFFMYFAFVILNIFVQVIKGNKILSSAVGSVGLGMMFLFIIYFNSDKDKLGDLKKVIDIMDIFGVGAYVMGISMFALTTVPHFFKDEEDEEFEELIRRAEMLSQDTYTPSKNNTVSSHSSIQVNVNDSADEVKKLKERIAQLEKGNKTTTATKRPAPPKPAQLKPQPVASAENNTTEIEELKKTKAELEKEMLKMEIANLKKQIESMKKD